jgi:hypothetical protein
MRACRLAFVFTITLLLAHQRPLRAGSVTAESVMGRQNALARAMEQMPRGAQVIRKRCEEISVGIGNYRDRCTVWYEEAPEPRQTSPED